MSRFDSTTIQTIHLLSEGGKVRIPADSGSGPLYRPSATSDRGGRVATLETLFDYFIDYVPDPDEGLRQDPDLLNKLHSHPYVQAAIIKRTLTVASFPWQIGPNPKAPDQTLAKQVAEYATWVWEQIGNIQQLYQEMQLAVLSGGVGIEWTWHREASGSERPVAFNPIDKSRFVFDRLGNMALKTRGQPVWGAYVAPNPQRPDLTYFPRGKFMYHVHKRRPGTWERPEFEGYLYYGVGEDVSLYIPVTFDCFILRFRMKWLEMFGIPPMVLYHPANDSVTGQIQRVADSLRGQSLTTVPRPVGKGEENSWYKVDTLQVPSVGYDAFQTFSQDWTKPAVYSILLGSADETEKGEHGGYSDHVSRRDSGPMIWFKWDAQNISATINSQIIPSLCKGRWPNLPSAYYPVHRLEPGEEKDRAQEMEIAEKAAQLVPLAEDEVYERSGFRKPGPNEKTVFNGGAQGGMNSDDAFAMGGAPPQGMNFGKPGGKPPQGKPTQMTGQPKAPVGQNLQAGANSTAQRPRLPKPDNAPKTRTMPR